MPNPTIRLVGGGDFLGDEDWRILARRLMLSPRELQILQHVFADEKEQTIAVRLGISLHTVHAHLRRIYGKLGVNSRVEAVVRVFAEYVARGRNACPLPSAPVAFAYSRRIAA